MINWCHKRSAGTWRRVHGPALKAMPARHYFSEFSGQSIHGPCPPFTHEKYRAFYHGTQYLPFFINLEL